MDKQLSDKSIWKFMEIITIKVKIRSQQILLQ